MKVAINGFGRIGRMVLRAYVERVAKGETLPFEIIAINDLAPSDINAHLLKYDSVHGTMTEDVSANDHTLHIKGKKTLSLTVLKESNPENLPWKDLGVDVVFECSGRFTSGDTAKAHLNAGARKVIISAPGTDVDATIVYGVNHETLTKDHHIISNASCTTNCLAPVAKVLHESFSIEQGYMTTIHSYTADQRLVDSFHQDLYRARAAAMSLIPTTTGAAKAVGFVLPELKGKLDGTAIRVPTPNVSLIDFKFTTHKDLSKEVINHAMTSASENELKGVLAVNNIPLVSIDFQSNPHSSIFDLSQTQVIGNRFGRVLSWYDNEWGFSNRMLDLTSHIAFYNF